MTTEGNNTVTSWLPFARIALEWLHPKLDLEPREWVDSVVETARSAGIDTLAFDFWHGGYAVFNGSIAPKDTHVGDADVIAMLDEATHNAGMRLVLMNMGGHCNSYTSEEHPSWRVVDNQDVPRDGINSGIMCMNGPYSSYLLQELRGLLPRYKVDGLYIEGLYQLDCYCRYCRTGFRETYGYEIPDDAATAHASSDYQQFRASISTNFVRRCRDLLDAVAPDTLFIPCPSWFEGNWADYAAWGEYADAVALERQWGAERCTCPLFEIGMSLQVVQAESKKPAFGTLWLAWGVDRNYASCPPAHFKLNFGEILLYGGTPQLHVQTLFEVDPTRIPTVREMYEFEGKLRPDLVGAKPVRYAALVVDYRELAITENFKGYYQALVEAHIPFEVLSVSDICTTDLSTFSVVILPNVVRLSDQAVDSLVDYCESGGGVVFTYRTGQEDEHGTRRAGSPLHALAGTTKPYGTVTNPALLAEPHGLLERRDFEIQPQTYYRLRPGTPLADHPDAAGLLSFRGSYLQVAVLDGDVHADALAYDYSKMHRHHPVLGWYPGPEADPLIIAAARTGRCVFVAGEFDSDAYKSGQANILANLADAVTWAAAKEPPVRIAGPITVEAATHFSPSTSAFTTILVNQTTNQLHPGWVVREVQDIHDVRLSIRTEREVREVTSAMSGAIPWRVEGGVVIATLPRLAEVDAVTFRLAE